MARTFADKQNDYIMRNINGSQVGKILAVDIETETLSVELYNKDFMFDNTIPKNGSNVVLDGVPFFVYSGGVASIEMPITTGDDCLIVFCDYNYNSWMKTQSIDTDTNTPHSRNFPVALVGLRTSAVISKEYSVNDIVIKNGMISKLIISPNNIDSTAENINVTSTVGPLNLVSATTVNISSAASGKKLVDAIEGALIAVRDGVDTSGNPFNGSTKAAINAAIAEVKEVIG